MGNLLKISIFFYLLLWSFQSSAQVTESLGEFFDQIREQKIQPSQVKLGEGSHRSLVLSADKRSRILRTNDSHIYRSTDLEFVSGRLENDQIIVRVKSKTLRVSYDIYFGDWIHLDTALTGLQKSLGFHTKSKLLMSDTKIAMTNDEISQVMRVWRTSPQKLRWTQYWKTSNKNNNESILLKKGLAVLVEDNWSRQHSWSDLNKLEGSGVLTLLAVWYQCASLTSNHNIEMNSENHIRLSGFEYCLGYNLDSGTPNMYAPNVFNKTFINRHKSVLTFNLIGRDSGFRKALEKIKLVDLNEFLNLTEKLNQDDIERFFLESGYSPGMAELFSTRMMLRRNELVRLFNSQNTSYSYSEYSPRNEIDEIQEGENIVDGALVKDYTTFKVDRTQSLLDFLFHKIAKPALKSIEATAKMMLEQFPYTGVELIKFGQSFIGAGLMFRLKRQVELDPEATNMEERYKVRDTVKLGLTINLGRNFKPAPKLNLWATVGGGYMASYSLQKYVASMEDAEKEFWMIPYNLIFETDFNTLNPGETLSVQAGFIGIGGFGGNFKIRRAIRPAGYTLLSTNYLNNFQVTRTRDDHFFILQGEDDYWSFQSKLYLRLVNRFFRIPFFGYTFKNGEGYTKNFYISKERYNNLGAEARERFDLIVQSTLDSEDVSELEKVVGYVKTDFDYKSSLGFMNMFGVRLVRSDSRGYFSVESFVEEFDGLELEEEASDTENSWNSKQDIAVDSQNQMPTSVAPNSSISKPEVIKIESIDRFDDEIAKEFSNELPEAKTDIPGSDEVFKNYAPKGEYFITKSLDSVIDTDADSPQNSRCQAAGILQYKSKDHKEIVDGSLVFNCYLRVELRNENQLLELAHYLSKFTVFKDSEEYQQFYNLHEVVINEPLVIDVSYTGQIYWEDLKRFIVFSPDSNRQIINSSIESFIESKQYSEARMAEHTRMVFNQQMWQFQNMRTTQIRLEEIIGFIFNTQSYSSPLSVGEQYRSHLFGQFNTSYYNLALTVESKRSTFNQLIELQKGQREYPPTVKYYLWRESPGIKGIIDGL